jgi:hypothetical protein
LGWISALHRSDDTLNKITKKKKKKKKKNEKYKKKKKEVQTNKQMAHEFVSVLKRRGL